VIFIVLIILYYKMRLLDQYKNDILLKIQAVVGFGVLTMLFISVFILSVVYLGIYGNIWVNYQAGQCLETNIDYKLVLLSGRIKGCPTQYILTETVLIAETNTVGTAINTDVRSTTMQTYQIFYHEGRRVGTVYPCYYYQSSVVFKRTPFFPFIISGIISLLLGFWSIFELRRTRL